MESTWCFGQQSLERWAHFSGDWNDIHFDRQAALQLGVPDIIVHGMIPILLAQEAAYGKLIESLPRAPQGGPGASGQYTSRVRLKRPLIKGHPAVLHLQTVPLGIGFSLSSGAGAQQHLVGTLGAQVQTPLPVCPPRGSVPCLPLTPISILASTLDARVRELQYVLPEVQTAWVCLSGIIFAAFLNQHLPLLQRAAVAVIAPSLKGEYSMAAVQTTFAVTISAACFNQRCGDGWDDYECVFEPVWLFPVEGGSLTECRIAVHQQSRFVMGLSIGVMLKRTSRTNLGE